MSTASWNCWREHDAQRDLLHAGLDRRALSRNDPADRRRRARAREPRLRPRSRQRAGLRPVPRRHPPRQGGARGRRRPRGEGLPRAQLFDRRQEQLGVRLPGRGRLPLQLEHLSDPPRPLRRCRIRRGSPHEVRPGLVEVPISTVRGFNSNWPAGGGGYFRLLPYRVSRWSIRRINRGGRPVRDVLLPPLGDSTRSSPASADPDARRCSGTT